MMNSRAMGILWIVVVLAGGIMAGPAKAQTFGSDVSFLQKHTDVVVLRDRAGDAQVVVLPGMQGRVMTSTAGGADGYSFGWVNREFIAAGKLVEHMNAFGGEDRFWIGPEGGQFSIYFKKGVPFDFEHWFTPAPIDTEPFELASKSWHSVVLRKTMQLENYSGVTFDVRVDREVRILERDDVAQTLGLRTDPAVKMVAFESKNRMTNVGTKPWTKQTGLLSIWILGMFKPSAETTVAAPFNAGPESTLGPIVNDTYFGKVPANRLIVREGIIYFSGDGQYRSKIGFSPRRARNVLGSYDAANNALTFVQYDKPEGVLDYVNSMWELQEEPFRGDTVNAYNDGPPEPGAKPMGPFYEMETSSPAAALDPGASIVHTHRTFHFKAPEAQLDPIAKAVLGVTLAEIKSALPR